MAASPRRSQARTGGLYTGADRSRPGAGAGRQRDSGGPTHRVPLVSIWAVALASGLVALGLTEAISALAVQRSMRVFLQIATILVISVVAGLVCESTLMRVRSAINDRHHQP